MRGGSLTDLVLQPIGKSLAVRSDRGRTDRRSGSRCSALPRDRSEPADMDRSILPLRMVAIRRTASRRRADAAMRGVRPLLVPGKQNVKPGRRRRGYPTVPSLGQRTSVPNPARARGGLAAKNKCLADRNKTRTADEATNERLHPGHLHHPVVQIGAASALCRAGAVPPHAHCAHPTARKNCRPCLAVELKFIGRHQRQHLTG